ncbi:MAG: SAM-dependent MidA family methyltransferase [Verrucomicrobiales bacterium]|jgi:SAM-dependent MidA family methyltransferase
MAPIMNPLSQKGKPPHARAEGPIRGKIDELVKKNGERGISFAKFMEIALYDPDHGYYSRPRPIGKSGDFFTSVSVGRCFGMLLARWIRECQQLLNSPPDFAVIEQGAHDGRLAADILAELPESVGYRILEPTEKLRVAQKERLGDRVEFRGNAETGVFICNELVDAFPVHRVRFENGAWRELRVVLESDDLVERPFECPPELAEFLPETALENHTTEVCPAAAAWIDGLPKFLKHGYFAIIDYGLEGEDFLSPERADGTLRCYRSHVATDDPFDAIGETDITTQVNFTQLQIAAAAAGLETVEFTDQSRFLTRIAESWLRELDGKPPNAEQAALLRQFQTLTHPGLMGRAFKVLVLRTRQIG